MILKASRSCDIVKELKMALGQRDGDKLEDKDRVMWVRKSVEFKSVRRRRVDSVLLISLDVNTLQSCFRTALGISRQSRRDEAPRKTHC